MPNNTIRGQSIRGYRIIGSLSFRYFKWEITNVSGGINQGSNSYPQASEFVFTVNGINQSMSGVTVTNPGGSNPVNEDPSKLVDGNTATKFLDSNNLVSRSTVVIFDFGTVRTFYGYNWATANDVSARDPRTWTVSGSNDNSNWTLLSTVVDFIATTSRFTYNPGWSFS